jgi:outer membrane protein assembly factor BamB
MIRGLSTLLATMLVFGAATGTHANDIVDKSGITGGLVIHVGAGDGKLTQSFCRNESFIVHGLDASAGNVGKARELAAAADDAGRVAFSTFDGTDLPFIDNLANLVVVSGSASKVSGKEVFRVLAPRGVAVVSARSQVPPGIVALPSTIDGTEYLVYSKPVPANIDEWTHYLHGPGNNAVALDTVVGPPRHVQWVGAPSWTRNHHKLNSISSVVTANGRLFFILDEATAANMSVPGKWSLFARDAFNGVDLWKKPLESWVWHGGRFRSGPPQATRLLVAVGDRLYLPLGLSAAVSEVDAVTGKTLGTFADTTGAEEIVHVGTTLLVLKGSPIAEQAIGHVSFKGQYKSPNQKAIVAIDAPTGKTLWTWTDPNMNPLPETLAADDRGVYAQLNNSVVCIDIKTGKERWCFGDRGGKRTGTKGFGKSVLVVSDGVVLCNLANKLVAVNAVDGKKLWETQGGMGFHAPMDVFVIDGLVWTGDHPRDSVAPPPVRDFSRALDLRTGEVKSENQSMVDIQTAGHHHRCYREKATQRYIIAGKRGIEMQDLAGNEHSRNNWVRGTCQYGMMPANGLIYAPSHSCGCYPESKLWGFYAMAAKRPLVRMPDSQRLRKGPALGNDLQASAAGGASDWPMLRQNALRNGVAAASVPSKLKPAWNVALSGRLTQPVIADGKVVVSAIDKNTVYALDEKTGKIAWERTLGGRVDSAPSIHAGTILFGCTDGNVYCLRLSDGEPAWSFLAAPQDMKTISYGRVESVWPVHGSVLVLNGVAYCAAGRSTWLDGGIDMYGLDPATGKVVSFNHYASRHPVAGDGKDKVKPEYNKGNAQNRADYKTALQPDLADSFSMAGGAIADILVSDGKNVFLHHDKFDAKLQKQKMSRHFFSTSGLLDGAENHRSHWVMGSGDFSMVGVAYSWIVNGRRSGMSAIFALMMAYDDEAIWGVNRKNYTLFQAKNKPFSDDEEPLNDFKAPKKQPQQKGKKKGAPKDSRIAWQSALSLRPRAMLKAGDHLFFGGMPKEAAKDDPHATYEGRKGGLLSVVSAKDGTTVEQYALDSPVVWDGMAAADGKLFFVTEKGELQCWGAK